MNALGVHILVSLFFVIATIIEFAVVLFIKRIIGNNRNPVDTNELQTNHDFEDDHIRFYQDGCYSVTDRIDLAALFVFLITYVIFNCVYIEHYM